MGRYLTDHNKEVIKNQPPARGTKTASRSPRYQDRWAGRPRVGSGWAGTRNINDHSKEIIKEGRVGVGRYLKEKIRDHFMEIIKEQPPARDTRTASRSPRYPGRQAGRPRVGSGWAGT